MENKESYHGNQLCFSCAHYYFNNGESDTTGCRAFPQGIPSSVYGGYNHRKVVNGQVGSYVYQEAGYEDLCPFAQYLYKLEHG
ncbi:hypothetical protein [uncultured Phocaeicola sp.]|uniref:hypothetical protein n=1 Tax=uncultured Phocaeicola sp. TaxID=990718 RepID=UPI0025AE3BEF|nr:hypothetical protein [uncultured Phocaeicola sp.]